jgi:hypothetical protein
MFVHAHQRPSRYSRAWSDPKFARHGRQAWPHSGKKYSFPFLSLINKAEGKLIIRYYFDHSESQSRALPRRPIWDYMETAKRPFILDAIREMQGDFDRFFKGYPG